MRWRDIVEEGRVDLGRNHSEALGAAVGLGRRGIEDGRNCGCRSRSCRLEESEVLAFPKGNANFNAQRRSGQAAKDISLHMSYMYDLHCRSFYFAHCAVTSSARLLLQKA